MRIRSAVLAVLLVAAGLGRVAVADEARDKSLRRLMELAADFFEMNRYVESRAELDKLLAEHPSDEEAKKLMDAFGAKLLHRMNGFMEKGRTLGDGPMELLKRAQRFEQQDLLAPEKITQIVKDAVRDPESNPKNLMDVARLGAYAAPELIQHLKNRQDDAARTNAEFILAHLGSQVVLPLAAALGDNSDSLLQQQICRILKTLRPLDPRCLPQLKRVAEDATLLPPVRESAKDALQAITGKSADTLPTAAEFFLAEANRYYTGGADIDREADGMQRLFWVWDANAKILRSMDVPKFALADVLAEDLAYQGLALAKDKEPFEILIASILLQQASRNNMLSSIVDYQQERFPDVEALQKDVREWKTRLGRLENADGFAIGYRNTNIAWSVGLTMLSSVLEKALVDHKDDIACAAITGIETIGGTTGWNTVSTWSRPASRLSVAVKADAETAKETKDAKNTQDVKGAKGAKTVEAPKPAVAAAPQETVNPLLSALHSPLPRIRIAAANCLARIGLPVTHPEYANLLTALVDGVAETKEVIALLVSNSPKLREDMAKILDARGVLPMTAVGGREAVPLAIQYPPKDAILIDNSVEEFDQLHNRLAMRQVVQDASIPLTIITVQERVGAISQQFMRKVNGKWEDDPAWAITTVNDASPDDPRIFQNLKMLKRFATEKQPVVILTHPNRQDRVRLKQMLMLVSEQESRPERLTQLARLRGEKALTDIYGVRATFSNVFLDEELSGYDVMKTLTELRQDPRTRPVPVAVLTDADRKEAVERDLKEFLGDDADVRILDRKIGADDLLAAIKDMKDKNPLSKRNYMRRESDLLAVHSAEAINQLAIEKAGLKLTADQVETLLAAVSEKTAQLRPLDLRAAVADVLGRFQVDRAAKVLAAVFQNEDKANLGLRVACMGALGACDTKGDYRAMMQEALNESGYEGYEKVQEAATRSLARLSDDPAGRLSVITGLRPNDPAKLMAPVEAKPEAEKPAETPKAEAKPAEETPATPAPAQPAEAAPGW